MDSTDKRQRAKELGDVVKAARLARKVRPVSLSVVSGVSIAALYAIERGDTRNPSLLTLNALWRTLEIPAEVLARLTNRTPEEITGGVQP